MITRSVEEWKKVIVIKFEVFNSGFDHLFMNYELQNFARVSTSVTKS